MKQLTHHPDKATPSVQMSDREIGSTLQTIQEKPEFEDLILSISTDFISLSNREIDTGIVQGLQKLANFLQTDRSFVALLNPLSKQLEVKFEWNQIGLCSVCPELQKIAFDWESSFHQILVEQEYLCYPNIQKMPNDCASLKVQFKKCSIVGFLAIGIFLENEFAGFVGFATAKEGCSLPTESKKMLKIIGHIVGSLMIRKQTYDQLNVFTENLRSLHRLKTTVYQNFEEQFKDYLEAGREIFGMDTGTVSRVSNDTYHVESIVSNWIGIKAGMEFPCSWMYCSKVIEEQRTIFYNHVGSIPEMQNHFGYKKMKIESYIGSPIFVNGRIYGILNFIKKTPRHQLFVKQDEEIIEMMAQGIGKLIQTKIIESEREEALQELQNSKARYQAILENQTEFICRFSPEGTPTFLNQTFLNYLADQLISLVDFNFREFIGFKDPEFDKELKSLSHEEPFMTYIHKWELPEGEEKWERWNCRAIYNANEELVEYQGVGQDITERKMAELRLSKTNEYLEEIATNLKRSNEDLRQFAYAASHDLQEPIRMISSYLQLIERRYKQKLDSEAIEFIDYAVSGAKRMQILINDLLAYSRVNTQKKSMENTDLNSVLEIVLHTLKGKIINTAAIVKVDHLPMSTIDTSQFIRLFQNLIENALKFKKESLSPIIHIFAKDKENHWEFGVKDNGIGIEPEFAEKIFVIFQRLHTRQEYPGTGIGLAVCKKIVERHNGTIWIESQEGEGTTFFFTLPK
ncbi:MAG: ATP-binding protein [Chitinophagales bacterium]